jgi:hypothetical protein
MSDENNNDNQQQQSEDDIDEIQVNEDDIDSTQERIYNDEFFLSKKKPFYYRMCI